MSVLIKKLVDSIQHLACIRCLNTGKDLYYNQAYAGMLDKHTATKRQCFTISDTIEQSRDVITRANFTFCKHLDDIFKKDKRTTFAEEILDTTKYYSLRTLINYNDNDAMLIIIAEDFEPFSLDNAASHVK